eukprot:gene6629-336_t
MTAGNKKRIDRRVRTLIENGVHSRQRTCIVLVGNRARDQVVNLHFILEKASLRAKPSVLWCYKKDLGFTTHRGKRLAEEKKLARRGVHLDTQEEVFSRFLSGTQIRFCFYKETHKILGNTYGMLVLQDFEALSPNVLARTVETVEGGGLILFLLTTVKSLKQFYSMAMDIHQRFRTEAHQHVVPRFNERFLLSLKHMDNCLILDETLDVVPWALKTLHLKPVMESRPEDDDSYKELTELKVSLADTQPIGTLVSQAKTIDQAKALLQFVEAISERTLRSTVTLTAARGRGKSATLGLSIAAAIAYGYASIFVTSPSPENLTTLFDFVLKGFKCLSYDDQNDYDVIRSKDPEHKHAVVRINIYNKDHRQTIQYIDPQQSSKVTNAELVVIDEAAAIPLPFVKALLGPYIVFMASTINGYEGTGRSLSLKLIQQLRQKVGNQKLNTNQQKLRELSLDTPIRYARGDPVEAWLNGLLCLDSTLAPPSTKQCPHPSACDMYSINRDTLFSYNKVSELFLQRMVALYVASHYKNTPNDLQLLSDAPAHRIFTLLAPITSPNELPEILCVVQVALEGDISLKTVRSTLRQGIKQAGDLIPWTMCQQSLLVAVFPISFILIPCHLISLSQQYQDDNFGQLSGARIVRIATHPDYQGMGYGKRAIEQLKAFYNGTLLDISESGQRHNIESDPEGFDQNEEEILQPRKNLPPLIRKLDEVEPDTLDYLALQTDNQTNFTFKGVSFGATGPLYNIDTQNELTGEHTCIMLYPLETSRMSGKWLRPFWMDFIHRYMVLLGSSFRHFLPSLALGILETVPCVSQEDDATEEDLTIAVLESTFTSYDLKRLNSYVNQMVDFHVILDLVPSVAKLFFTQKLTQVQLSPVQQGILLGLGLQHKTIEEMESSLGLPASQLLGLFRRALEQINKAFRKLQEAHIRCFILELPTAIEDDLDRLQQEAGQEELQKLESAAYVNEEHRQRLLDTFSKYSITADEEAFNQAIVGKGSVSRVSIARKEKPVEASAKRTANPLDDQEKHLKGVKQAGKKAKKAKGAPSKKLKHHKKSK